MHSVTPAPSPRPRMNHARVLNNSNPHRSKSVPPPSSLCVHSRCSCVEKTAFHSRNCHHSRRHFFLFHKVTCCSRGWVDCARTHAHNYGKVRRWGVRIGWFNQTARVAVCVFAIKLEWHSNASPPQTEEHHWVHSICQTRDTVCEIVGLAIDHRADERQRPRDNVQQIGHLRCNGAHTHPICLRVRACACTLSTVAQSVEWVGPVCVCVWLNHNTESLTHPHTHLITKNQLKYYYPPTSHLCKQTHGSSCDRVENR